MKHTARMTTAARLGRWLGGVWGGCLRAERRTHRWLMAQGLPAGGARVLIWMVKLAILGVLLYVAVWAALLLVALVVAARMAEQAPQGEDDFLGSKAEELDHRESLFYHPASYNDDPDPRFGDD
ncbi:TPA: DUF3742 family protein [Pseudomonas aeruginosa]|uniref:DUF3742 family protein n=1 Tax=Pseudomonadota TaxID=1224 RepID=UPI001EEED7CE|nr:MULTISPECIES: DUF3742 family protein [Pseudomonadota]MCG7024015.1 DUF3742 family protein [Pseudomonas aeruginosa]MCG7035578.1 DUF3742 family protein [Pseudomonas aeruginosa]MCG7041275.1 DUF3742 family protein [Pseudomonas aeruginosa]MCG7054251.1 DUF3742 family protein [Pseudomonas aeruginosa]MCG7072015.1 DUF3742 family protein [Pseudomonas aeruginosa]